MQEGYTAFFCEQPKYFQAYWLMVAVFEFYGYLRHCDDGWSIINKWLLSEGQKVFPV